jgi:hypothetical protein
VLWAERFKSVLLEGGEALAAVAAYIELNPVRAGLCADRKDYRYCGYAEVYSSLKTFACLRTGRFAPAIRIQTSFSFTFPRVSDLSLFFLCPSFSLI